MSHERRGGSSVHARTLIGLVCASALIIDAGCLSGCGSSGGGALTGDAGAPDSSLPGIEHDAAGDSGLPATNDDGAADGATTGPDDEAVDVVASNVDDSGEAGDDSAVVAVDSGEAGPDLDAAADSAQAGGDADTDAGSAADASGGGTDSGAATDSGSAVDSGSTGSDAAGTSDSGSTTDSGSPTDAGGTNPDSGGGGCTGKPTISAVAPASGGTVSVSTPNSSTWYYDFQANVTFCQPMALVRFDYQGPNGICLQQEHQFATPESPFSQNTQVGGSVGSLTTCGNGKASQSWQFIVTATDSSNQTTTLSVPFTLSVSNH